MIQKIGKLLTTFILFFSFFSDLYAAPCADWALLLPPAREGAAMAFDSTRNQTILFGGFSNGQLITDTWSWDGTKWTELFPSNSPSGRQFAAMAFDPISNLIILFGGVSNSGLGDTWSWDGTNWTQQSPGTSPSARSGASMAFDSINNLLILFGGFSGNATMNDTWNWNGNNWVQLLDGSTNSPTPRSFATMAFGPTVEQMILFGGFGTNTRMNDTWSWDGASTTWNVLNDSSPPPARSNAVMGYDPVNQLNILFGGQSNSADLSDTWSWDGSTWSVPPSITTSPSARDSASFALDANNNLILFGGINGQIFGDTWSWTGTDWTVLINPPSSRSNASMAFDSSTDQLILFGGFDSLGNALMVLLDTTSNTWNFDSFPAFFAVATPSNESICSGGMTSIVISANVPGATFSWTADASGVSGASDGTGPLIAQTLSLTSSCTGTVIYTISPTNPSGCQGSPVTVVVTVNPLPFAAATPPIQTISSGETATIVLSSNIPGTTFSWTVVANGVSGASSGSGSLISQTLSTTTSAAGTVTYTIISTSPTGCTGSPLIAVVTVGSSSSNILPPTCVRGCHLRKINVIKWQPPKSGEPPVSYRIYRNAELTKLTAEIPANQKLVFKDDNSKSCHTHTYYIVSVDSSGNQSDPVSVSTKKNVIDRI